MKQHTYVNLFNFDEQIRFYIMQTLNSFNEILESDALTAIKVVIHTNDNF